jgi:hypothetical protein
MARMNVRTPNTNISAGSINTNFIKDAAVTTAKIADGAITSAKIGVDVIVAEDIANNAITVAELQDNAVTTAKILDANVTNAKIADGSITAAKIADGTIIAQELASDSVTTIKILDANVTTAKILDANVTTAKILDANVTTAKILDANVTTAKILDANVTVAKMAVNSVDSDQYVDGSIDTVHIADDAVTLAKISTTGASDNQILVYDHASTSIVWETPSVHYTDAEAITAVQGEATLDLTGKTSISNSAGLLTPILHLVTDNTGTDKTHILLEDSVDDAVSIVGRTNTSWYRYQTLMTMDPNHTKPRTNVGGTGVTSAGDYAFDFLKYYGSNQDTISMDMNVWGANDGFNIIARDDENGGVDSYNYKPIRLKGSDIAMRIGTTPFGSTVEKLAFNDFGTAFSNGAVVHGLDRNTSNHQIQYTGTCTAGTPGVPSFTWIMHRRDAQNRIMEVLEATDYGSGDAAVVEIGKQLTVNPVKVASAVAVELANLSSAPGSPTAGMMYFNTSDSKFYGYNGSAWVLLDTQ